MQCVLTSQLTHFCLPVYIYLTRDLLVVCPCICMHIVLWPATIVYNYQLTLSHMIPIYYAYLDVSLLSLSSWLSLSLCSSSCLSMGHTLCPCLYVSQYSCISPSLCSVCWHPIDPFLSTSLCLSDKTSNSTLSMHMYAPCTMTCYHCI